MCCERIRLARRPRTAVDGSMTATEPYNENAKYIGLLLYAVRQGDATEAKVGSWEIAVETPARFLLAFLPLLLL